MSNSGILEITLSGGVIPPSEGGTGVANPTAHTLPVAEGSSPFHFLGPLTNGQLLIGSTGGDPVPASLTAGANISITNGAGSITIAAGSGGQVVEVTAVNTTYTALTTDYVIAATTGSPYTISLLASPETGRSYRIKDVSGGAASNNLTISGNGANIDGASTYVINQNYGSVDVCFTGTVWSIL